MLSRLYYSLRSSTWLGWQIESNWTDSFLFGIYSFAKPISSALILVFMYLVVTRTSTAAPFFAYMYVGNAFYMFVANVLFGISWVILEDREFFEMLKYVYISPLRMYLYLFGRGMAKLSITTIAVIITLAFGILFLRLPVDPLRIDYGLLGVALVIGLWGITSLGIILAAISLLVARHSSYMNEGVAGLFYLLCGAIFPIEVLPAWLQPVSRALPFTYWLEAIRRAVLPGVDPISKSMAAFSTSALLLILVTTTVSLSLVSHLTFRLCEHRARSKGLIDRTTAY